MYADDGIMYSDKPFKAPTRAGNIELHQEKSRWLKENNKWLVPSFKFLGLEYLTKEKLIKGKTRNGSNLEFDAKRRGLLALIAKIDPRKTASRSKKDSMDWLAGSGLLGLIQAKLQPIANVHENHKIVFFQLSTVYMGTKLQGEYYEDMGLFN